jgi:hypothetical protein
MFANGKPVQQLYLKLVVINKKLPLFTENSRLFKKIIEMSYQETPLFLSN